MSDEKPLAGKVAFITGAGRGQGRSHAVGLAKDGADIVIQDICRDLESLAYPLASEADLAETKALVEAEDQRCISGIGDVRDIEHLRALAAQAKDEFGRIDIVVANAGIMAPLTPGDNDEGFYDSIDVMLKGPWNTIRATQYIMSEGGNGGVICLTSSTAGSVGITFPNHAGAAGYGASKHGVMGLLKYYANALAKDNIRVVAIQPTGVNTPMVVNPAFGAFVEQYPELATLLQNALPVPLIEPEDVTDAIRWVVSDKARYVTGSSIKVDAGFINCH